MCIFFLPLFVSFSIQPHFPEKATRLHPKLWNKGHFRKKRSEKCIETVKKCARYVLTEILRNCAVSATHSVLSGNLYFSSKIFRNSTIQDANHQLRRHLLNKYLFVFSSALSRQRGLSWSNIIFAKSFVVLAFRHDTLTQFTFHHFIETCLAICNRFSCYPPGCYSPSSYSYSGH